jgi:hypothetical protein
MSFRIGTLLCYEPVMPSVARAVSLSFSWYTHVCEQTVFGMNLFDMFLQP